MKDTPKQPGDTANDNELPARARAARRIDATTIAEIARLCAKALTESESCRLLGISPRQWFNWKDKHNRSEKFAALLEEFRAGRIDGLIARIEGSADGKDMKQPDWRAAAFLLSVADRERFSSNAPAPPPMPTGALPPHLLALMMKQLATVYASPPAPKLAKVPEIKQLNAPPESKKSA